jgi:hypothetical protein
MKYGSIFLIFLAIVISSGLQSCKKSTAIDEKKFIKIYADMVFMQDTSSLSQPIIKEKVLEKYKVSENDYDNIIKFYNDDPEKWQSFFDSVIVYIERIKPIPKKIDVKSLPEQSVSVGKKNH